jgi:hypothetical protein
MKRRSAVKSKRALSCYQRHGKHPFDYSTLYSNAPHLRRPLQQHRMGAYAPHVNNPHYDWRANDATVC